MLYQVLKYTLDTYTLDITILVGLFVAKEKQHRSHINCDQWCFAVFFSVFTGSLRAMEDLWGGLKMDDTTDGEVQHTLGFTDFLLSVSSINKGTSN